MKNNLYTKKTSAKNYFNFIQNSNYNLAEQEIMKAFLPDIEAKTCLEIGCAGAIFSRMMLKKHAKEIRSFDYSENMIEEASKVNPTPIYELKDINHVWEENKIFDFVCASFVLHYAQNFGTAITNIKRQLKLNGQLIFSIPNPQLNYDLEIKSKEVKTTISAEIVSFYNHPISSIVKTLSQDFEIEKCEVNEEILVIRCRLVTN